MPRRRELRGKVIPLAEARVRRHLARTEEKLERMLSCSQRSIQRMCETGALYTDSGTRAGRDLLLVHQHLLRVLAVIRRLRGGKTSARQERHLLNEVEGLLEQTDVLTQRTGTYLHRLRRE